MSLLPIIRIVENDINLYEYYRDIMARKYVRKPILRYICELNKLNRLLNEKHGELKRLTMQCDQDRNRDIFYSKKYSPKVKSICDRPNKDKNRENMEIDCREVVATKILNIKKHHSQFLGKSSPTQPKSNAKDVSKDTSKIFYSQKYRTKLKGSSPKDQLMENKTNKRNEEKSSQLGNSQFEKFKNMYLKWVQEN